MPLGSVLPAGRSLERAYQYVQLAESLDYHSVYVSHIAGRESLTLLTAYALKTKRIRIGPAVVPIYTRTPATMAQTAATLDEISGGRLDLGLGVSHQVVVEHWYGQRIERPVAEMREYATIVRAILRGEDPPPGERWRTSFHLAGVEPRPQLPIYIAALSPRMLRLAGEIADGVMLWLCEPAYIERVVVPEVAAGRERAGKSLEGFDVMAPIPSSALDDPEPGEETLRRELLTYFGLPFYRKMLAASGFGPEIAAFDAAAGDPEAMAAAISDRFLRSLAAIGDGATIAAAVQRYRDAGTTSPCIAPIGGSDVEATLRAGAAA